MNTRRQRRVANHIQRILSEIIGSGTRDPRIGFVSIMGVDLSPDLKNARVSVSVLGDEEEVARTLKGLESARGFLQGELGARGGLRYTPRISFRLDRSIDENMKMEDMLRKLKEEGQFPPPEDDQDTGQADLPDQG